MKKLISFFIVGALLTAGLIGCNKAEDTTGGTAPTGTEKPTEGTAEPVKAEAGK